MKKSVRIGKISAGDDYPVIIIAEVSLNHNGDMNIAKKMIDVASEAGADIIKFQTFRAEGFISDKNMTYTYKEYSGKKTESQFDMFKRLELPFEWHKKLKDYAESKKLIFMSTPGDEECADFLEKLGVAAFKVGSDDLTNLRLIEHIAKKGKPMIISTGMSTMDEIEDAVQTIYSTGNKQIVILHCSSEYPANPENVNLNFIKTLKKKFDVPIGFSDHTPGIAVPIASVAVGACLIEKHFTLDKKMTGPDHSFSSDPIELNLLVEGCRMAKKSIGSGIRNMTEEEKEMKRISRKSIVAASDIKKGEKFSNENLAIKRASGVGLEPRLIKKIIGKEVSKDIKEGTPITYGIIKNEDA